jgi:thymidylate synthase
MSKADLPYRNLVIDVLKNGNHKPNRTGVDTISKFGVSYEIDNSYGFPLLTTKKMDGYRWDSMIHELIWYLSGEHHIRNLREKTGIWDAWADEDGNLDTAYGRFWRHFPLPSYSGKLEGETWDDMEACYENSSTSYDEESRWSFDQIQYVIDNLKENPNSRRHVVTAWHPANAAVSTLPPCHLMFIFNVQNGNELNLHLTQRSGDVALGIPFNIASYSLLQRLIAQETGMEVGSFHHTIVDAHIYCGKGERGEWWEKHLPDLQYFLEGDYTGDFFSEKFVGSEAPEQGDPYDHIPGLLKQISREAYGTPEIEIADKPIDDIEYDDIELKNYESHSGIQFEVAE